MRQTGDCLCRAMERTTENRNAEQLPLDNEELLTGEERLQEAWWEQECQRRAQQLRRDLETFQHRKRQQVSKMAELAKRWQELEQRRVSREQEYLSRCVTRMTSRQASFLLTDRPASSPRSRERTASR